MGTTPVYALRYPELTDAPHGPNQIKNLADDVEAQLARIAQSAKVRRVAPQTITAGTTQNIAWDTMVKDTGGMVPTVANGIKVLATAEYQVDGQIAINATSVTTFHVAIRVNGVDRQMVLRQNLTTGNAPIVFSWSIGEFALVANDVVTVGIFHNSGASPGGDRTTWDGSTTYRTELAVRRMP
jgi:hypothetical protein